MPGGAQEAVAQHGQERHQDQQGDGRLAAGPAGGSGGLGTVGLDLLQQAVLEFPLGLLEIGVGQGAFGLFPFQFGQLVAENDQVRGAPVGAAGGGLAAQPEGRQQEGGDDDNEQRRE